MFGIGAQEIIIIMIVALIIVGPQRLPEVAGQVAKAIRDFRRMSDDLTGEFQRSLTLDDDKKPNPLLTDEVITASSTPESIGASIAHSLRVEAIPNETVTPVSPGPDDTNPTSTVPGSALQPEHATLNEDSVISLAPVATKGAPLIGVSLLDQDMAYVGTTYPAKASPAITDYVYEPSAIPEHDPVALDAEPIPTGEADAVRAQNGISDAWDAVISTEATASPLGTGVTGIDERAPDIIQTPVYAPVGSQHIDPEAEPTIREKIEAQVAAEAFRERRRIASYQRSRKQS